MYGLVDLVDLVGVHLVNVKEDLKLKIVLLNKTLHLKNYLLVKKLMLIINKKIIVKHVTPLVQKTEKHKNVKHVAVKGK